ncbi:hypothetical protein PVNG_05972 [Plasmodium vivax North Korean]|uniref:Uncharacterized protein n=1 Tax=Plasmodium vivax North Korean TaxID=1035514 RepID=A0A0J9U0Z3_PLAVI|nr:hypothetical protein PVNG_05972 [Plasmodium vivax North Korean]
MEMNSNNELNETVLNKLYQSYFDTECIDLAHSYGSFVTCYSDGFEGTLPSNLRELYKKFERNLILLCDKSKEFTVPWENNEGKLCFYLKYWIYDQLISNNVSQDEFSQFFKLWNDHKGKEYSQCACKFEIKNFLKVNQLKQVYDYFLFLEAYEKISKIQDKVSNMNYCKYIEEAKILYSLYLSNCEDSIADYCKEFMKYIAPYKKNDDENSILCESESTYEPDQEDYQKAQGIPMKLAAIKEKDQEYNAQLAKAEEDDVPVPEATRDDTARAQSPQDNVLPFISEDRSAGHVLKDTFPGSDGFIHSPGLNTGTEGNGSPTKTIASASLVGIPSIMFLLYKVNKIYCLNYLYKISFVQFVHNIFIFNYYNYVYKCIFFIQKSVFPN